MRGAVDLERDRVIPLEVGLAAGANNDDVVVDLTTVDGTAPTR